MAHKNDYSVVAFMESGNPKKWPYVHSLFSIGKHLDAKYPNWKYFNVYERRTKKYLKRFYKGNFIPAFLNLIAWVCLLFPLAALMADPLNSTFNNSGEASVFFFLTFNNGFNNTATIWTLSKKKEVCL